MKIVFMGTPDFALPTLQQLLASRHQVVLVVTGPDKPRGRGQRVQPTPVKRMALQAGIPVYQPEKLRSSEVVSELQKYPAELFVVVAFRILPEAILAIPPLGVINLHASLLPRYRGAAPIQWVLLNGENETGVTTFFIEKNIDSGDIILQRRTPIAPEETAGELHDRLAKLGAELIVESVELIAKGNPPRRKQEGEVTLAPKITREMCKIHWQQPSEKIVNQIRAFSPLPGAFTFLEQKLVKIYRARTAHEWIQGAPGQILRAGSRLFCKTGDGSIEILELQLEGKKRLLAGDFLKGFLISRSMRFSNLDR